MLGVKIFEILCQFRTTARDQMQSLLKKNQFISFYTLIKTHKVFTTDDSKKGRNMIIRS